MSYGDRAERRFRNRAFGNDTLTENELASARRIGLVAGVVGIALEAGSPSEFGGWLTLLSALVLVSLAAAMLRDGVRPGLGHPLRARLIRVGRVLGTLCLGFGIPGITLAVVTWAMVHWFVGVDNVWPGLTPRADGLPWTPERWLGLVVDLCQQVSEGSIGPHEFPQLRHEVEHTLRTGVALHAFRRHIAGSQTAPIRQFLEAVRNCGREVERNT